MLRPIQNREMKKLSKILKKGEGERLKDRNTKKTKRK
jgi:hypothetical protein